MVRVSEDFVRLDFYDYVFVLNLLLNEKVKEFMVFGKLVYYLVFGQLLFLVMELVCLVFVQNVEKNIYFFVVGILQLRNVICEFY